LVFLTDLTKTFANLLLHGDTTNAYKLVENLIFEGYTSLYVYENIVREALYYIGYLWEIDEISVADEHLATGTADFVLTKLDANLGQMLTNEQHERNSKQVMLFCIEGEEHYIGIKMAANVFKEHNWNVKYLGPNLPLEHAIHFANKMKPNVICFSVTVSHHLKQIPTYIKALENLDYKPQLMIGSRLIDKYQFSHFVSKDTIILSDLEELSHWIKERAKQRDRAKTFN